MKRILLVEDDLSLISGLSFAVRKQGYDLDIARTSCEANAIWEDGKYDDGFGCFTARRFRL